jgi:hypothetical protein
MLIDIPLNCPTIILRNFNANMLVKTSKSTMLKKFMNKYKCEIIIFECTTIYNTQLDHVWTNALIQQCFSSIT